MDKIKLDTLSGNAENSFIEGIDPLIEEVKKYVKKLFIKK